MFAKRVKNDCPNVGQTRSGRNAARPASLPDFLRSDPDSELAARYRRVKTASLKSKLPVQPKTRRGTQKILPPVENEYAHVRSPVGDYIRQPFIRVEIPPDRGHSDCQNASNIGDRTGVGLEVGNLDREEEIGYLNSKKALSNFDLEVIFEKGLAELQFCETTPEVFETYAKTFHNVLDQVAYVADTTSVSTQISPKLQRTQTHLLYAGPWESCTSRKNTYVQTEDQNLTFAKQRPTAMHLENSKPSWSMKLLGWKFVGAMFLVSTLVLGLMEIPNFI